MIFITGGKAQGKSEWAKTFATTVVDDLQDKIWDWMLENLKSKDDDKEIGQNILKEIEQLIVNEKDSVIICQEIGCGIVPMDKKEALWREVTGRSACMLAKVATDVYRMQAGIPQKIK